jgi:hypothetical protein
MCVNVNECAEHSRAGQRLAACGWRGVFVVEPRGRFGRDHDESVRLLEGASDQLSRSELLPLLGTIVDPSVPSAMGTLL